MVGQAPSGGDARPLFPRDPEVALRRQCIPKRAVHLRSRLVGLTTLLVVAIALFHAVATPAVAIDLRSLGQTAPPEANKDDVALADASERPSCRIFVDATATQSRFLLLQGFEDDADVAVFDTFPAIAPGLGDVASAQAYQKLRPGFLSISEFLWSQPKPLLVQPRHCHAHLLIASELHRSLGSARLEGLLKDIHQASIEDASFPFMFARDDLQAMDARAKGYYQLLGVNYLDARISPSLAPGDAELSGVISFHEDSLVLGFDVQERWRRAVRRKQLSRSLNMTDFYLYEHLDFVQDRLHLGIARHLFQQLETEDAKLKPVAHPCFPHGFTETLPVVGAKATPNGVEFQGAGDAAKCVKALAEFVESTNQDCPQRSFCLLNSVSQPKPVGPFFASGKISAVVTFANDVLLRQQSKEREDATVAPLELPLPTLAHVRAAAEHLCATPVSLFKDWEMEYEGGSKSTSSACFELCQVIVLLQRLGVSETERRIVFGEPVVPNSKAAAIEAAHEDVVNKEIKTTHKSNEVAWLVGLFLVHQVMEKRQTFSLEADLFAERVGEGLPIGLDLSVLLFVAACVFLYLTTGSRLIKTKAAGYDPLNNGSSSINAASRNGRRTTSSIVFVDDASE